MIGVKSDISPSGVRVSPCEVAAASVTKALANCHSFGVGVS